MGDADFFSDDARKAFKKAIETVERQTSVDVVIAVKKQTDSYRDVDYLVGAGAGFLALLILLFHPMEFQVIGMPLEVAMAFALATFCSASTWSIKRRLLSSKRLRNVLHRGAAAAFVDQGIGRTAARNGMLVYVSVLEREVEIITDVGLDRSRLGAGFEQACEGMAAALRHGPNLEAFKSSFIAMGPFLGALMPRLHDDVNELSDEVGVS